MRKLMDWIRRHQVTAFFILTFAITWGLGFSYGAVITQNQYFLAPLLAVATCGPALAGIILAAITNTSPRKGRKRTYWIAFLAAWVISALVFLAHNTFINHAPLTPLMAGLTFVVVLPVAFVISMAWSRIPNVRNLLSSLVRPRRAWGWCFVALVLTPALILLSALVSSLLGREPLSANKFPELTWTLAGLILVAFLYQFFFFNATGEEAGWRGFALPRLQSFTSPLIASLVLALFWPLWHFFLWQAEGAPVLTLDYWLGQYILHVPATFTLVWIYNRSQGSILAAGIAHAAGNTAFAFLYLADQPVYNWTVVGVVLVMILADRMWKKLPPGHPAVYQAPEAPVQPGGEA